MVCLAMTKSCSVAPDSGLGTSPSCTSADEARERINVENVTCGMEQSQPGLLQSQALWSSGEAAFMVSPWNECL